MATSIKKAIAQVAFQFAVSFLEYEVRAKLKEKGIDPDQFERILKELLEANKTSSRRVIGNDTMTVAVAFRELGLPSSATPQEIKSKFKKLVLENHSDRTKNPATEEKLKKAINAYNVLKDAGRAK